MCDFVLLSFIISYWQYLVCSKNYESHFMNFSPSFSYWIFLMTKFYFKQFMLKYPQSTYICLSLRMKVPYTSQVNEKLKGSLCFYVWLYVRYDRRLKLKGCGKNQLWPNWGSFDLSGYFTDNKIDIKNDRRKIICWDVGWI